MQLVYMALSGSPRGCIEFYGISVVSPDSSPEEELYLVFELASEKSIWKYMEREGVYFGWLDIIDIFAQMAWGLWDGLHTKHIAHGYDCLSFALMNGSDLHENNVLVTRRFYAADAQDPEANRPVLIDFGRGSLRSGLLNQDEGEDVFNWEDQDVVHGLELHTIAEDIQAYGALIWELTLRWMKMTDCNMIPRPLVEIMANCMSPDPEDRPSMVEVVRLLEVLERETRTKSGKTKSVSEISRKDAKAMLKPLLMSSADRPKPSAPSYRQMDAFSYPTIGWSYESEEEEA